MPHKSRTDAPDGKVSPRTALRVVLSTEAPTTRAEAASFAPEQVREALRGRTIVAGELLDAPQAKQGAGEELRLKVVSTTPDGKVEVADDTRVEVHQCEARAKAASGVDAMYDDIRVLRPILGQIREMIELPLQRPELFEQLGIAPPRGVLVRGLPTAGSGRLSKAVAEEIDAQLCRVTGAELASLDPDEAEAKLQGVFAEATGAGRAIILIDDVDVVARRRDWTSSDSERRLGACLLDLMDRLNPHADVVVVAVTYRPEALDESLRRPGRFDREIVVSVPDHPARKEILGIALAGKPLASDVDVDELAKLTWGYAISDLGAFVREAALQALRAECPFEDLTKAPSEPPAIRHDDFLQAMKRVRPSALHEVVVQTPMIGWEDVGVAAGVEERLRKSLVLPMKRPDALARLGGRPSHGFLLFGPPGNGKSLVCAAAAREAGASLIVLSVSELLTKGQPVSEQIDSVFARAREVAPAVIFIDEIDRLTNAYGDDRSPARNGLNALLSELDALAQTPGVVVVGATARPSILEPDLLRGGRLEELVYVPVPDQPARRRILYIATRDTPLAPDVDLERVAQDTERYTGADLVGVVRGAALAALHRDMDMVDAAAFREAVRDARASVTEEMEDAYEETAITLKQEPARRPGIGFALPVASAEAED